MLLTVKEKCSHCLKNINLGQKFFECFNCSCIIHEKCFKTSHAESINSHFYCFSCKKHISKRYNPFKALISDHQDESNDDPLIMKVSQTLESCQSFSTYELNTHLSDSLKSYGGMLFLNIDGNKSNFDHFAAELSRLKIKFPVIGLAETNIEPDESSVYFIEGYKAFYQSTQPNKSKGTGVAIYIHDSISAVINENCSLVTENLESLFITILGQAQPVNIGVIYRPPSGDSQTSLNELETLLETLPKSGVHIMGDFNYNLHDESSNKTQAFEQVILETGFFPSISIPTHEKPGCKVSCIDNILTNEIESTISSGTLKLNISHHHAVFHINSNILQSKTDAAPKPVQYYDYCNTNVDTFLKDLTRDLSSKNPSDFSTFYTLFQSQLDNAFKLEKPKQSKRTPVTNPWITSGLIRSIEVKDGLYDCWKTLQKKKCVALSSTCSPENNVSTCHVCKNVTNAYLKYHTHRKQLKYLINSAKKLYYKGKLLELSLIHI